MTPIVLSGLGVAYMLIGALVARVVSRDSIDEYEAGDGLMAVLMSVFWPAVALVVGVWWLLEHAGKLIIGRLDGDDR